MNELKDHWKEFLRSYKSSKRWFIGIIISIIFFLAFYVIESYATTRNAVTEEQLHEYVKTEEMLSWLLLEMEYVKRIILLDKAEVSDSIINEVFENHEWMLLQFMEYNPRSLNSKPDYSNIINNYKKRNK